MTDTVLPILVTGGAGYVGSHACKALAKAGFEPHTFDDLSRGHRGGVKWGPLILGDVSDQQALEQALTETGAVAVLHLAGLSDVGVSVRDPLPYYDVNIGGALALASAMIDTGGRFAYFLKHVRGLWHARDHSNCGIDATGTNQSLRRL